MKDTRLVLLTASFVLATTPVFASDNGSARLDSKTLVEWANRQPKAGDPPNGGLVLCTSIDDCEIGGSDVVANNDGEDANFISDDNSPAGGSLSAGSSSTWYRCQETVRADAIKACTEIIEATGVARDSLGYAHVYRGYASLRAKDLDSAPADFNDALKSGAPLAHAYYGLGLLYKAKEDWPHAADAFAKAAASPGEDSDVDHFTFDSLGGFRADPLDEEGYALIKEGKLDEAQAVLAEAAKTCPTCAEPLRYEGFALTTAKRFPEARQALYRAIALDPRAPGGFFFLGVLEAFAGRGNDAIADYLEALRLDPAFDLARGALARAYSRAGVSSGNEEPPKAAGEPLDESHMIALFAAKDWSAANGVWAAALEFRADGSFRWRGHDQNDSTLAAQRDGSWAVVNGQICLYTNRRVCMNAFEQGPQVVLARADDSVIEFTGDASAFKPSRADNASAPIAEFPLDEKFLAGSPKGGKSRTLLYYIHGFEGRTPIHSPLREYFIEQIRKSEGWDVIDADYPADPGPNGQVMRYDAANFGAAAFVARRLKALKAQGYDRIVVGGQSWGGWTSLVLSTEPNVPITASLLIVPACCGFLNAGPDDPELRYNVLLFNQLIEHVRYPTIAVFFQGDRGETTDRGKNAERVLAAHHIPGLVIDHPPGLIGHGAGWLPAFDYEFRDCIVAFVKAPRTSRCAPRPIKTGDFRVTFEGTGTPLGEHDLAERAFARWPMGDIVTIGPDASRVTSYSLGTNDWPSRFEGNAFCMRGRERYLQAVSTDEQCVNLVQFSPHELLALDPKSGTVVAWWTEMGF